MAIMVLLFIIGIKGDREPRLEYIEDVEVMAGEDAVLMCIFSYYSSTGYVFCLIFFFFVFQKLLRRGSSC